MSDGVRVDVWLWTVRIFRTRTASNNACASGTVRVNGAAVKPSRVVHPGDVVTARVAGRPRTLEVVETPPKRLGAALARAAVVDTSPPIETRQRPLLGQGIRERGAGRPTKRDRRKIERLQGKPPDKRRR